MHRRPDVTGLPFSSSLLPAWLKLGPEAGLALVPLALLLLAPPPASAARPDGVGWERPPAVAPPPASEVRDTSRAESPDPFRRPPADVLRARRTRLLDSLGAGTVVLDAASPDELGRYPQASDFRQDNDFYYLTGLETPESWLVLRSDGRGKRSAGLFVPEPDESEARWTGDQPDAAEASRISGVEDVRYTQEFEEMMRAGRLRGLVRSEAPLYVPLDEGTFRSETLRRIVTRFPWEVRGVEPTLGQLRVVKDEFELEMLRHAIRVTDDAHRAAMRAARPGGYEYELEAVIEYTFRMGGAERVGFPSIVGSGPNSTVLHYDESRRRTEEGDLVVMDVGAEYSYYTADVTRTIPVSGTFTERQEKLYELVLGSLKAGIDAVEPGATLAHVERAARTYMEDHSDGLCGEKNCERYLIHGTGHWLGLDVHDVGDYSTPFQPGMVFTVEPGVYLPEEEVGIRIEEDVLVTPEGAEVLSAAPRTVEEIEAAMAEEPRR